MRDILRDLYYGNYAAFERTYSRESEQAKALGIVVDLEEKLALSLRLHIRCMKKAPKTALCAKETKKEPETFRFPAFSGRGDRI